MPQRATRAFDRDKTKPSRAFLRVRARKRFRTDRLLTLESKNAGDRGQQTKFIQIMFAMLRARHESLRNVEQKEWLQKVVVKVNATEIALDGFRKPRETFDDFDWRAARQPRTRLYIEVKQIPSRRRV